jgi:alpha-galactosidase
MRICQIRIARALLAGMALAVSQGLALSQQVTLVPAPPMGWSSWNHFARNVTAADVKAAADAMVSSGMRDAGYLYVNIDDAWEGERDAQGRIHSNAKFSDMKALAQYVHGKGLKLGIYSSPGPKTCAGFEGSMGHEREDAQTYADWGIDYLKYDLCTFGGYSKQLTNGDRQKQYPMIVHAYGVMHEALLATHRPIVYSISQYGWDVWNWGPRVGANLWRTTADIKDNYPRMAEIGFAQVGMARYAGPGHWNDPDMLEVGNGGMTAEEYRSHMSLWAILAAPLIAGNDLSSMDEETRKMLLNRDVIAVDQDAMGVEGDRVSAVGPYEVWSRPLKNGDRAVGLFNRSEYAHDVTFRLQDSGMNGVVHAVDLWTHKPVGAMRGSYTAMVAPHGVVMLRISR